MLTVLHAITYIPVHVVPFPMKPSTQSQVKLPTESLQTAFTSQLSRPSMHSLMSAVQRRFIMYSAILLTYADECCYYALVHTQWPGMLCNVCACVYACELYSERFILKRLSTLWFRK